MYVGHALQNRFPQSAVEASLPLQSIFSDVFTVLQIMYEPFA